MIDTRNIKQMVKAIVRRDKGLRDARIMHPARDWFLGIVVSLVVIIVGGAYSAFSYATYDAADISSETVAQSLITYKSTQVDEAITSYSALKATHTALINDVPAPVTLPVLPTATSTGEIIDTPLVTGTEEDTILVPEATVEAEAESEIAVPAL